MNWIRHYRHRLSEKVHEAALSRPRTVDKGRLSKVNTEPTPIVALSWEDLRLGAQRMNFVFSDTDYEEIIWPSWECMSGRDSPPNGEEFVHLILGPILEYRRDYVVKAFSKMCNQKEGSIHMNYLERFYSLPSQFAQQFGKPPFQDSDLILSINLLNPS
ncbi:hypothetical protein Ciccas_005256 [Cichlidogyrus casuarinus]|uniref:Uncharacterized protein n=1 Tax=Cichlidogyrus casuarinus TaxID=1844966 RepID=A0ABD2Q962_9PLAT